jgi:hypothetical protein
MKLNDMSTPKLRKTAAQFNIAGRSNMKRAELIDALNAPEMANLLELHLYLIDTETAPEAKTFHRQVKDAIGFKW